jgi:hypothetical protein
MWFHPWPAFPKASSPPRRPARARPRAQRDRRAGPPLFLEHLEDRSLPDAAPLPIPGGVLIPNPFGGPDVHHRFPGPADATSGPNGGEPSTITDFDGFVGVAHVQGTGTDGQGNSLLWDADLRFMQGDYRAVDGRLHHGTFAFI